MLTGVSYLIFSRVRRLVAAREKNQNLFYPNRARISSSWELKPWLSILGSLALGVKSWAGLEAWVSSLTQHLLYFATTFAAGALVESFAIIFCVMFQRSLSNNYQCSHLPNHSAAVPADLQSCNVSFLSLLPWHPDKCFSLSSFFNFMQYFKK